jgi:hypothetical protein
LRLRALSAQNAVPQGTRQKTHKDAFWKVRAIAERSTAGACAGVDEIGAVKTPLPLCDYGGRRTERGPSVSQ